jgi:hypothetical protein
MERRKPAVQFIHVPVLFTDPFFREAVCIKSGFAVVADDEIFKSMIYAGFCHFFNGVQTIAPVTMAVNDTFYI